MSAAPDCDVLVCGLGPVGQLLALLLSRRGVSVIAIDKAAGPYDLPRAAVVDDEVLRIFQAARVVDEILQDSQPQEEVSFVTRGARTFTLLAPERGSQGHQPLVSIHQPSIERTLVAALAEQESAEMRWRHRLERLLQTNDGVQALVRRDADTTETITSRWVVGCDGGTSWVRRLLGIEFGGSTFRQRWLVVDAHVDRPLAKVGHPHFFGDPERPIVSLPMSPGRHRWEWMIHPGEDEEPFLDPVAIRQRIDPWLDGEEATVERAVIYTFHARVAARWREGRVLLAGDAAHLMPPFAGQGFSSGARDAANLAWKLEAVLNGAPQALLDTYEAERRTHVIAFTRLAITLGRFVQTTNGRMAVGRDVFLTGLERSGIAAWLRERIKPLPAYGAGAFAERPARLSFRRDVGSQFPQPAVRTAEGDFPFDELAGPGWCAISTLEDGAAPFAAEGLRALMLRRDLEDRAGVIERWLSDAGATWVVLRPDRFVFARGSGEEEAWRTVDELRRQLGRAADRLGPAAVPSEALVGAVT
jgi:3-(3-hydroxy-phenyl)propionate hydroxylase